MNKRVLYLLLGISINMCHATSDIMDVAIDDDISDLAGDDGDFKGKTKKICKLCTECLTVTKTLNVNGAVTINAPATRALATALTINGSEIVNGALNVNGNILLNGKSVTAGSGSTFLASYGQLSRTSPQSIYFLSANTFYPVPFNASGPSSNVTVSTTSPATMTIQQAGVYQVNASLYISSQDSSESTFTATTYTLGLNINGTTTAVAAVYAGQPGLFSLSYNACLTFSVGDAVQFYIKTSATGGGNIFDNIVKLESGNANLLQIAH